MKQTDTRPLFATQWAQQADSSTIASIPQSATAIGRASMALGFPKATMTPIAAGGVPPYGEDMNGILNLLSRAAQAAELGILRPFSADYATAINGYPAGATIAHPTITGRFLICTADNNTNDPSQSMNGWLDPLDKLQSALQQETQRAQTAETGLLPLAGGTITGPINRSGGGVLPEVLGMSGRVVIQAFTAQGNGPGGTGDVYIQFPTAFAANSKPIVSMTINREPDTYHSRFVNFGNNGNLNNPNINNTGLFFEPTWVSFEGNIISGTSAYPWTVHVVAVGVL